MAIHDLHLNESFPDKPAAEHGGEGVGAALRAPADPRVRAQFGHLRRRRRRRWRRSRCCRGQGALSGTISVHDRREDALVLCFKEEEA